MTTEQHTDGIDAQAVERDLLSFLEARTKTSVTPTQELFASGLVSSMFAMELVVQLEKEYGISIVGTDLRLDNFRTVASMTELVLRLGGPGAADGA
ncbi:MULTISPECIES: acyl carrier protein [Streptomyces]|uniref:Methoxymalonate biosynthesis protein n=1 Tax=Streptomyces qinglanensis TaxID=943816 RepID=A0A1E7KD44_9ACTN|nr:MULTISPECIES: acyl carrier protein [Streptomyces]MBE9498206.1 acyl carrier protein [Streptomyces sp. GKU 257-1]OEV01846.1 methoxymalonate biosynthesis protein [Streptomyces qinglanensis]OEV07628.1 methoxymalonate biosynthesis protein [Streptomyces nanshensis]